MKGLVAAVPVPLREKVLAEIRAGHTASVRRRTPRSRARTGEDLTIATEMVELLEETAR